MPSGGSLVVCLAAVDGCAQISVTDSGHGMDEATKARAFEPFFTTKGVGVGTGLGLAMAHGFVDQSGGRIWIESEPGLGTTVWISLPLLEAHVETTAAEPGDEPRLHLGKRVLLTEDDPGVRGVVTRILRDLGSDVTTASSPADALAACSAAEPFDVLITDMVMPEMNGIDLSERVRELQPSIEVLFISGYAQDVIAERADFDATSVRFLQKPFTPAELTNALAELGRASAVEV